MVRNSLCATAVLIAGFLFWALDALRFLQPYRSWIFGECLIWILLYLGMAAVNLFALLFLVSRKLLLKDTGRKLAHAEKQLRGHMTFSEELSRRLEEQ